MFLSMRLSRSEFRRCGLVGLNTVTSQPCSQVWIHNELNIFTSNYGRDWLDPRLYDLCVSTSIGLDRAATLINDAVVFPDNNRTPTGKDEVSLCPVLGQL